jgi:ABC-2 type transport system permease protein
MLGNIFLKTVRDYRWSILWWGGGVAFLMGATAAAYPTLFSGSGANQAKQQADLQDLANSFSFLTGKVPEINTLGGFMYLKAIIYGVVLFALFAILAGSALIRGEEERGSLDILLSTPHSRRNVLLQKVAGLLVVVAFMGVVGWLGLVGGAASAKIDISIGAAALTFLDEALVALVYGSLALLLGQILTRKEAAAWAGGILAATYAMFTIGDSLDSLAWLKPFSPIYYFNLSKPLIPSVGMNWWAMAMLVVLTIVFTVASLSMYLHRDQNDFFHLLRRNRKVNTSINSLDQPKSTWLRNDFLFGLHASLPGAVIWGIGIAAYVALIMSIFKSFRESLMGFLNGADIYKQLGFDVTPSNESLLGLSVMFFLVILYAAYAVTQVWNWTGEETEGRLELTLSTPQPRWRLTLVRFAVTAFSSFVVVIIALLTFLISAAIFNVTVDIGKSIQAFLGLWIICLIIAACGFALSAFKASNATALLGGLVIVSYLLNLLADIFKLPSWVVSLSIFNEYGQPLSQGLKLLPQLIILGLVAAFLAIAVARFHQRDIAK